MAHTEFSETGSRPAEEVVCFVAFRDNRNLIVIGSQIIVFFDLRTSQYVTADNADIFVTSHDLSVNQTGDRTAGNCLNVSSLCRFGTGYHNQAAEIGDALIEQTADNDHVGRIYRPDHFTLIDRFNVINLYSHIGRRMRTFHFYSFNTFHTNGRTFTDADIHLAVGKFCKRIQSRLKINFLSFHDEIEVRS